MKEKGLLKKEHYALFEIDENIERLIEKLEKKDTGEKNQNLELI